jgi:hypothetical protein
VGVVCCIVFVFFGFGTVYVVAEYIGSLDTAFGLTVHATSAMCKCECEFRSGCTYIFVRETRCNGMLFSRDTLATIVP